MEAMLIVGLSLGSFVKGPDNELTMKTFIKHVTAVTPIIKERRKAIRPDTQFFFNHSRENLFVSWGIKLRTWNERRTEDGKFSHCLEVPEPVFKKPRKEKFNFAILREDLHEDAEVTEV